MITVIAPHGRPEFSANLLANFQRQRGVEARLLVVENGAAEGEFPRVEGVRFARSVPHQADAMNAGLDWLRERGGGPWARFDDDDYYGPDYLASVERSLAGADGLVVSGMPWRFVMLDDGLYQFTNESDVFTGGTLAASTADVAQFERYRDDDLQWCRAMRERGALFVEREPLGYCYDRTTRLSPRVIPGGPAVTRFGFGPALFYGPHLMSAVDYPGLEPLCSRDRPSNAELMAEMRSPSV